MQFKLSLFLLFLCALIAALKRVADHFIDQRLYHKTKSFDAEAQYPDHLAYLAQPAKSFDAEREAAMLGDGYLAKTLKQY